MTRYHIRHHVKHHWHRAKSHVHNKMAAPHQYLSEKIGWYRWWHEHDIHRHIHYAAMLVGIILATYYVMLDGIFQRLQYSATDIIGLIS